MTIKGVIDTNYFIKRNMEDRKIDTGYITSSVLEEIKDRETEEYYNIHSFYIKIRDPAEKYVHRVIKTINGKNFLLSSTDIDVVALTLELTDEVENKWIGKDTIDNLDSVVCLTEDNGILSALYLFGININEGFQQKEWKFRCYSCYAIYENEIDFCKKCGYSTITRIAILKDGNSERLLLKKDYNLKEKILKTKKGKIIRTEDQKEYEYYKIEKKIEERKRFQAL